MINDSNIKKDYGVLVKRNYFMGIISLQDIDKLLEIQLGFSIKGTYHTVSVFVHLSSLCTFICILFIYYFLFLCKTTCAYFISYCIPI